MYTPRERRFAMYTCLMNDEKRPSVLHRVFVYGSLRRAECNHDVWFGRGVIPVADGYIRGAELISLGDYCCIVPTDDLAKTVVGEVYDVPSDLFRGIEAMEAAAGYVRKPVDVWGASHREEMCPLAAEAYFFATPERVADRPRIESGDWSLRSKRRE